MMRLSSLRYIVTGVLSVSMGLGCGGGRGPALGTVSGKITMNNDPVPGVNVIFVPERGGSPSYGGTDDKGVYRLLFNQRRAGAAIGTHNVLIERPEPKTDDRGNPIASKLTANIPRKYRQPGTLSVAVNSGRNKLDFALEAETRTASK